MRLALAIFGFAWVISPARADDRASAVDDLLAPLRVKDGPGCVVEAVQKGKPVYSTAFGLANVDRRIALDPSTQFNAASLTKQFTAASLYFLTTENKAHLQDSVRRFVPELPAYADSVTLADLLHHTSGLRDANPLLEVAGRLSERLDGAANLRLLSAQSALNFPPGTDYEYSNTDYFLLGLIVERASGQSLAEYASAHIFRPLGMTHSAFQDAPVSHTQALGYTERRGRFQPADPPPLTNGDGGLYTTIDDLRLWAENLLTPRLGGPRLVRFLETSGRLRSGEPVGYGGGLSVGRYRGARLVSHDGVLPGYRSDFTQFPAYRFSSIVLCNRGDVDAPSLGRRIAAIYLADRLHPRPAAAALDYPTSAFPKLDGVWESKQGWILRAWSGVDGMTVETAEERHKLTPLNRRQLYADENGFRLTLTMLPNDTMTLRWDDGLPVSYRRVAAVAPTAAQLAGLAGDYRCPDAGALWTLIVDRGALLIATAAGWRIPLDPVGSDRFVVGPWSLHFLRGPDGSAGEIQLHRARLWTLRFEKVPSAASSGATRYLNSPSGLDPRDRRSTDR